MSNARVFRCPRCQEFVATDAKSCRFCSTPLDARAAELAADEQEKENRRYMRRRYARHMLTGAGLFAAGVAVTAVTFGAASASPQGGYFIVTWGLILYGAGDFLYGLAGWSGLLR